MKSQLRCRPWKHLGRMFQRGQDLSGPGVGCRKLRSWWAWVEWAVGREVRDEIQKLGRFWTTCRTLCHGEECGFDSSMTELLGGFEQREDVIQWV